MSDEISTASINANWVVTGIMAIWGLVLRVMVGRHFDAIDKVNGRLSSMEVELATIKGYLEAKKRRG